MKHTKRIAAATVLFAIVFLAVLFLARTPHSETEPGEVWVNEQVALPRAPMPVCDDLKGKDNGYSGMRLYVNGMDTGLKAVGCTDGLKPRAVFEVRRAKPAGAGAQADDAAWEALIGHPLRTLPDGRPLNYDIQWTKDGAPAAVQHLAEPGAAMVLRIFQWWAPAVLVVILYVWGMLVYLAHHTELLRDPAPPGTPLARRTYSLARTQMAWWFAIVFASFVFLWLVTGEMPAISAQALTLLGMSSATTMASTAVAPGRTSDEGVEGVFFLDLLSDSQGVAIHRFQMVTMTIAMGLIFLFDVVTRLSMPSFDPSLLTLVGISSATYVGLKIPEASQGATPGGTPAGDPKAGYTPSS